MTPQSQTEIVASLLESQRLFNATLAGVSDEQASRTPNTGGWSVLALVEHLVITESNLPRFFRSGLVAPGAIRDRAREAELQAIAGDRERKIPAPERVHPTGKFTGLAEARAAFDTAREGTLKFAAEHEAELDTTIVTHPLFGSLSMRQLLVLAAAHSTRHAAQIEEILRSL